jgi:hypothetical protein
MEWTWSAYCEQQEQQQQRQMVGVWRHWFKVRSQHGLLD